MKTLRSSILVSIFALAISITGCDTGTASSADPASAQTSGGNTMTKLGPEFTAAYICPMHCEGSGSDKPGKCPVCEMDYRENTDFKKPAQPDSTGH